MQIRKPVFVSRALAALWLVGVLAASIATPSHAKTKPDCCGSGDEVYTPSTQRIKITQSLELKKQLTALKNKPAELAKMRKAIDVGNKLIQGHVNHDLYQYGWEDSPKDSVLKEVGWQRNFGAMVAVSLKEFRAFNKKRYEGVMANQYITSPRYPHLLCPYSQIAAIQTSGDMLYLTYRFVHIARPNTDVYYMLDKSSLDTSKNGRVQTKTVALDGDFKMLPYDKTSSDWWDTYAWGIQSYKSDLRGREQTNLSLTEPYKPNLRMLLAQITEAEKVCNKPNPFQ